MRCTNLVENLMSWIIVRFRVGTGFGKRRFPKGRNSSILFKFSAINARSSSSRIGFLANIHQDLSSLRRAVESSFMNFPKPIEMFEQTQNKINFLVDSRQNNQQLLLRKYSYTALVYFVSTNICIMYIPAGIMLYTQGSICVPISFEPQHKRVP